MKRRVLQVFFWLWFISRGYYLWSKFWRFLFERRYRHMRLTPYVTMGQLASALGRMKWVQDPLWGLFDVVSSPQKVETQIREALLEGKTPKVGDCDEFAQYAATCLESMVRRKKATLVPYFLTVNWLDTSNKFHGHNVCSYVKDGNWYHVGNWFGGQSQGPFPSVEGVARSIAGDGQLIGYALATPGLQLVQLHLG